MRSTENHACQEPDARTKNALSRLRSAPFSVAAPSFAVPGTVTENARFLAPHFSEIGMVLFETESCLAYTERDLAPDLAELPLSWHVHLPLDLPWRQGVEKVGDRIAGLVAKVDYLRPKSYVLHPPRDADLLLPLAEAFGRAGVDTSRVLLENVEESDLAAVWPRALEAGYGACLDIGHLLAYSQEHVLTLDRLWEKVGMLHIYGPDKNARHQSLRALSGAGQKLLRDWLERLRPDATVTIEVFRADGLFESAGLLADWLEEWKEST
ncbi:cobamide remodeling phosphodiesterase CbiR [Salidesulfovibrio onnuriiensis]|uniref:cobamide remodeling phosphodiesterase CbiR n=1 Tax=Salidesulfovibrio onnuriiensis TaxID=2583823 RepID=UPI0011C8FC6A|nr:cobamide remodeling phosphodiesterase CbiR [Salidesulfovibrio onnuriiensis]